MSNEIYIYLAGVTFGIFVGGLVCYLASGITGLIMLLPRFSHLKGRYLLSLALLSVPAGWVYLDVFDLYLSDRYWATAVPFLFSALLMTTPVGRALPAQLEPSRRLRVMALILIPMIWGHLATFSAAFSCYAGACTG